MAGVEDPIVIQPPEAKPEVPAAAEPETEAPVKPEVVEEPAAAEEVPVEPEVVEEPPKEEAPAEAELVEDPPKEEAPAEAEVVEEKTVEAEETPVEPTPEPEAEPEVVITSTEQPGGQGTKEESVPVLAEEKVEVEAPPAEGKVEAEPTAA